MLDGGDGGEGLITRGDVPTGLVNGGLELDQAARVALDLLEARALRARKMVKFLCNLQYLGRPPQNY